MKCEEVFARLETGHALDRWRARRHAAGCAACTAALRSFEEAKLLWATTEPLTEHHRLLWRAATRQVAMLTSSRYKTRLAIAGFALAASLLLVYFASRPTPSAKNDDQREVATQIETPQAPVTIVPLSKDFIAAEFAPLEEKLHALEREIDQIQASAEKREAQFQLAQLMRQYSKREVNTP